ncbi:NepR family anti-sigma factor [Cucumibacter marinus]|uniref:NepR family anti-sigma factor n=1 Tax=Cucumibacter marinus TaxID=1121252 RepID=UPI00041AC408|nr:NepR family anti-sigma factor [Cucumibacter marinus]
MSSKPETKNEPVAAPPGRQDDALGPNSAIGKKLRALYDDVMSEEVPDRFMDLLGRLEDAEKSSGSQQPEDADGTSQDKED